MLAVRICRHREEREPLKAGSFFVFWQSDELYEVPKNRVMNSANISYEAGNLVGPLITGEKWLGVD